MRRIVIWLASTITVVVLLFGYHTSTNSPASTAVVSSPPATTSTTEPSTSSSRSSSSSSSAPSASTSTKSSTPSATASATSSTKSYTGDTAQTRWGPVQVKITVADGKITKVTVLQQPSGNPKDQEINDHALPILTSSTIDAQSAKIDMVSGATVTSDGYVQSLQSALDAAGI